MGWKNVFYCLMFEQKEANFLSRNFHKAAWLKNHSPCCVDRLLLELTVIDGADEVFEFRSWEFPWSESCRESENLLELKLATPLVTFATKELKKLIVFRKTIHNSSLKNTDHQMFIFIFTHKVFKFTSNGFSLFDSRDPFLYVIQTCC